MVSEEAGAQFPTRTFATRADFFGAHRSTITMILVWTPVVRLVIVLRRVSLRPAWWGVALYPFPPRVTRAAREIDERAQRWSGADR